MHGQYWLLPAASAIIWTATIVSLLCWWAVGDDASPYASRQPTVLFISHIGGYGSRQILFIVGAIITAITYVASLGLEFSLRARGRLPSVGLAATQATTGRAMVEGDESATSPAKREASVKWAIAGLVFATLGGLSLVMLAALNTYNFREAHWTFTVCFICSVAVSATCQTVSVMKLRRSHPDRQHLRRNSTVKLSVLFVALCSAIAFFACLGSCGAERGEDELSGRCDTIRSAAGGLEWWIAVLFAIYLVTLALDLAPSRKTTRSRVVAAMRAEDKA